MSAVDAVDLTALAVLETLGRVLDTMRGRVANMAVTRKDPKGHIYANGYKEGYLQALHDVQEAMQEAHGTIERSAATKQRIEGA